MCFLIRRGKEVGLSTEHRNRAAERTITLTCATVKDCAGARDKADDFRLEAADSKPSKWGSESDQHKLNYVFVRCGKYDSLVNLCDEYVMRRRKINQGEKENSFASSLVT